MKLSVSTLVLLCSASILAVAPAQPVDPAPAAAAAPQAAGNPAPGHPAALEVKILSPEAKSAKEEFDKLPKDKQEQFANLLVDGQRLLGERRIPEALEKLNEAEVLWALHPNVLNLKGAALVNIRDFERAKVYFEKAAAIYPDFWQTQFNLSEMYFVGKQWEEAQKRFRALLAMDTNLEGPTRRLIDYKIILCEIKLGRLDEARKMIAQYDIYDDTPIYYYATAALYFEQDKREEAEEWVNNARNVYANQINAVFEDSLTEIGWLFVF